MPNTLGHIGIQSLATRLLVPDADPKWIYLACIIPDVPWIVQRVVRAAAPGVDPATLRFYVDVQGSLAGSLVLSAAVAMLAVQFWKTFAILGGNAMLHLLLDAAQVKWANGVHFAAPFSWELTRFDWFWPESAADHVLTGVGLVYLLMHGREAMRRPAGLARWTARRGAACASFAALYVLAPLLLLSGPERADNHYLATLGDREARVGRYVEFDRARYTPGGDGGALRGDLAEFIQVDGLSVPHPATVSVRGIFVAEDRLRVLQHHVHQGDLRDQASMLGLGLVALLWLVALARTVRRRLRASARETLQAGSRQAA